MLELLSCAESTWHAVIEVLLACAQGREAVKALKDEKKWVASFDGFYLR